MRECLFGCYSSNKYFEGSVTAEILNGDWWFGFTTNGTSWTDQITISQTDVPFVDGGVYTVHITYDGTKITATASDGEHTKTASVIPAAMLYYNSNYYIAFGNIAQSGNLYAKDVYFDPDDCYIESNGVMVWGAKTL